MNVGWFAIQRAVAKWYSVTWPIQVLQRANEAVTNSRSSNNVPLNLVISNEIPGVGRGYDDRTDQTVWLFFELEHIHSCKMSMFLTSYWKGDCSTLDRFTAKVTATITSESDSFRLTEEQFCTCVTRFVYISLLSLHDQDVELPNFTFYGERVHKATIFSFFFLNQMIGQFIQGI